MKESIAFDIFYRPIFKDRPETRLAVSTEQVILNLLQEGQLPDANMRTAVDPQLLLYEAEQSAASQMLDTGADPNRYLPCMILFAHLFPEHCAASVVEWLADLSQDRFPGCVSSLEAVADKCRGTDGESSKSFLEEDAGSFGVAFARLCDTASASAAYRIAEAASSLAHENGWTREDKVAA